MDNRKKTIRNNIITIAIGIIFLVFTGSFYSNFDLIRNPILQTFLITISFYLISVFMASIVFHSIVISKKNRAFINGDDNNIPIGIKVGLMELRGRILNGTFIFFAVVIGIIYLSLFY